MDNQFDSLELFCLILDGASAFLFYYLYKKTSNLVDQLINAPTFQIDSKLHDIISDSKSKSLPFVCVKGLVKAKDSTISSQFLNVHGVVRQLCVYEHNKYHLKNEVKNNTYFVPFMLQNTKSKQEIQVLDPLNSDYILDSLQIVYDSYKPKEYDGINKILDALTGNIVKGYSEIEAMLIEGTFLTGFGMVKLNDENQLVLKAPVDGNSYILTSMTRQGLIEDIKSEANFYKISACILFGIGGIILFFWIRKQFKKKREYLQRQRAASSITQWDSSGDFIANNDEVNESNQCVICLTSPKNILLLPCRHVAICSNCVNALPDPKLCPICRGGIDDYIDVYLS